MRKSLRETVVAVIAATALGVGGVALAAYLGKQWELRDIFYDLGIALLVVGVVELSILRIFRKLAARQSEIERIEAYLNKSDERHNKQMQSFEQSMRDIKLDNVFSTVQKMDGVLTNKLDDINRKVTDLRCQYPAGKSPEDLK